MKKILLCVLLLVCIIFMASCKDNVQKEDDGKALETANTVFDVTGDAGSISIDENVARTLLGVFSKDAMGLVNTLDEYELELSATRIFNQDACMVEAFSEGSEVAEGTFVILGSECFVYDSKLQKYLLLTAKGAVEVSEEYVTQTQGADESSTQGFVYNEDNNRKLQERFEDYNIDELGIEKEISEYVLVVAGTTTTAADGEKVYVVRLYEKTGTATNLTLAFNESGSYFFDTEIGKYKKL